MEYDAPIATLFGKKALLSLEFFPPKTDSAAAELSKAAEAIALKVQPDFVSITYGAGGTTRERTFAYAQHLRSSFGWVVMPHLTCVGHSCDELIAIAESYARMGITNLMALRGDPPKGLANFQPHPQGLTYASELVGLLKTNVPQLCLGVAGYPEKHPEAPDAATDLAHLKHKVAQGASFITTQLFFDNNAYFKFVEQCRAAGIRVPILPGLMPALSLEQAERFCGFCKATLPDDFRLAMQSVQPADQWRVGVAWAARQARGLLKAGAPGLHFYIMNRSESVLELLSVLRSEGLLG